MSAVHREVALDVAAPAERLWELISDVTRMGQWSPENVGAEWLSGTPRERGARFRGHNRRGRASWSTTCEVLASQHGRLFAFAVGNGARPDSVWCYTFTPLPDGRTRVREEFELARPLGTVSRLVTRLITGVVDREADLVDGMRQTLTRLGAAAEQEGAAPLR